MNKNERITRQFAKVINEVSRENESNTPDFLLAEFLTTCLCAFENAVTDRAKHTNPSAEECHPIKYEDLLKSNDMWRSEAQEQQREARKWQHAQAEYKRALAKCSGDLLECIKAKDNQTRKLKETLDELTDLKMAILNEDDIKPMTEEERAKQPKNFASTLADAFGKIADIIGAQKRREAEAFKAMAERPDVDPVANAAKLQQWREQWVKDNLTAWREKVEIGANRLMANVYCIKMPSGQEYKFKIFDKTENRAEVFDKHVREIARRLTITPEHMDGNEAEMDKVLEAVEKLGVPGQPGFYWEPKKEGGEWFTDPRKKKNGEHKAPSGHTPPGYAYCGLRFPEQKKPRK